MSETTPDFGVQDKPIDKEPKEEPGIETFKRIKQQEEAVAILEAEIDDFRTREVELRHQVEELKTECRRIYSKYISELK